MNKVEVFLPELPIEVIKYIKECKRNCVNIIESVTRNPMPDVVFNYFLSSKMYKIDDRFKNYFLYWYYGGKESSGDLFYVRNRYGRPLLYKMHGMYVTIATKVNISREEQERNMKEYALTLEEICNYDDSYLAFVEPVEKVNQKEMLRFSELSKLWNKGENK